MNLRRWMVSLCTRRKAGATEGEWRSVRLSFSQFGEDLLLEHLLPPKGFYVDVGAYHPVTFSNTWLFSRNGWRGIVVEPNPEMARLQRQRRPRDIVVESAIGGREGEARYLHHPEANNNRILNPKETPEPGAKVNQVRVTTLGKILREFLPKDQAVDLLCVDCEGMDATVLRGNDWRLASPRVICAEAKDEAEEKILSRLLAPRGYRLQAQAGYSLIYVKG
jgi:FkbM family methyltransferase